jgi:hypothetical protein
VTSPSFQLAARRLRVLLRGVFHFRFATVFSVLRRLRGLARAFARIPIRPASRAEAPAVRTASQAHRQRAQDALLRQVRDVQAIAGEDVALPKRVDLASVRWIEPLLDVDVDLHIHVLQASAALTMHMGVDGSLDGEHPVRLAQLERDADGLRKGDPFERLDPHLVGNEHKLAAACEETADINPM